jgi:hypothetical protein
MLMPMSHYIPPVAGGFSITAGTFGGSFIGWLSASAAAAFGASSFGSASGDFAVDGGTAEAVYFFAAAAGHILLIENGSASASTVTVDGTDYTLTFSSTGSGFDQYTFGPATSLFVDSVTYAIEVT